MWISLSAEETTDNLLDNTTFDENTNGWTLSDSNVKRDANSYSDAGNSPTIRFKGQTSTISQMVDLTGVEAGKEIKSYTISYNGYGCGNSPGGWCNDGADDTITTNITFTDGTTTEISSHAISVPYEDGWTHHTFTKSVNDTFLTGDVAINFELSGVDTGNSNFWLGPITDNYELMVTYQDYVAPIVEPVVIEPIIEVVIVEPIIEQVVVVEPIIEQIIEPVAIIEEIAVIEETMIGGLELSTEVTLDLIQEIRIEIPQVEIIEMPPDMPDLASIGSIDTIEIEMPEMNMDMPEQVDTMSIDMPEMIEMPPVIQEIKIEMPVDIPDMIEVEPIQEIQEIVVDEPPQMEVRQEMPEMPEMVEPETTQPEMVETKDERRKIEPETESKIETVEAGSSDESSDIREPEPEEGERETKESTADTNKGDEPKETTTVATGKSSGSSEEKSSGGSKQSKAKPKSETKTNVQANRPTDTAKKNNRRPKATLQVSTTKPKAIEQPPLPITYLQIIQDSITIVETISLRQEQIYGGEQEYNLNTSSITIAGLDNNSSRRWNNLQNERKRFKAPKYSRRSKED